MKNPIQIQTQLEKPIQKPIVRNKVSVNEINVMSERVVFRSD